VICYSLYAQVYRLAPSGEIRLMSVIDKASSTPYYDQLTEILRREISEKQAEGEPFQLSSENELASSTASAGPRSGTPWTSWSVKAGSTARRESAPSPWCAAWNRN